MTGKSSTTTTTKEPTAAGSGTEGTEPATPEAAPAELGLPDLARAILAREIKPKVADIRRLAEAVLAAEGSGRPKGEGKKKDKKAAGKKSGKKRKLAKIPGQKK